MKFKKVLAIETSCDDTSVSIVGHDGFVFGVKQANQDLVHAPFGGVVPEIACRNHTIQMLPLIEALTKETGISLEQVDGIVVTNRPGLIGSLIVGVVTAKTLSQVLQKPLLGVNHLEGHIVAPFLKDEKYQTTHTVEEKFLTLAVSGGHSSIYLVEGFSKYRVLGETLDDAAGEAYDKFGKLLGLPFPGGVQVDRLAQQASLEDRQKYDFPRGLIHEDNFNMSFSGLKSSAQRLIEKMKPDEIEKEKTALCASFQEAVVEVLISKLERAQKKYKVNNIAITGGVSANSRLREGAQAWATRKKLNLVIPPLRYCTDNAAMIGYAGILRLNRGESQGMELAPSPQSVDGDFLNS